MKEEIKNSNSAFFDTCNEIRLFEQKEYCKNYIRKLYPDLSDDKLEYNSDVASACFRQANEFIKSGKLASLSTSPLLYSYALNNYAKGLTYLCEIDADTLNCFKEHGFQLKDEDIKDNVLDTEIIIGKYGAAKALLIVFDNQILVEQKITFDLLLSRIPELGNMYYNSTSRTPNVALININDRNSFILKGNILSDDQKEIGKEFGMVSNYIERTHEFNLAFNMKGKEKIENGIFSKDDIYYKSSLIFPAKFTDGIHSINVIYYCYLVIMNYGMLVRYNPNKWERFIDPKLSDEFALINISVDICLRIFLEQLHKKLFGYYFIEEKYTDNNVRRVIKDSTINIMNNITDYIENKNFQMNINYDLPWPKDLR